MLEVPRRPFVKNYTCLDGSIRIRDDHVCSRRSNLRPNESCPPFCNFGTGLRVIDCMVPRCFAAVMATIMQRFLPWQAIAKWRQQGFPRIWDDVSQVGWLGKHSGFRTLYMS